MTNNKIIYGVNDTTIDCLKVILKHYDEPEISKSLDIARFSILMSSWIDNHKDTEKNRNVINGDDSDDGYLSVLNNYRMKKNDALDSIQALKNDIKFITDGIVANKDYLDSRRKVISVSSDLEREKRKTIMGGISSFVKDRFPNVFNIMASKDTLEKINHINTLSEEVIDLERVIVDKEKEIKDLQEQLESKNAFIDDIKADIEKLNSERPEEKKAYDNVYGDSGLRKKESEINFFLSSSLKSILMESAKSSKQELPDFPDSLLHEAVVNIVNKANEVTDSSIRDKVIIDTIIEQRNLLEEKNNNYIAINDADLDILRSNLSKMVSHENKPGPEEELRLTTH